ncbi:MAG TPA: SUMF1/EgtB/PvdO family nonheme iron enzyme [Candidatus Saccharimonadales bacterium]|nr:SUMF1/EgtB/PvdO family nonheme iron enzyme [Candidatus Saccharimonadales bacterium]
MDRALEIPEYDHFAEANCLPNGIRIEKPLQLATFPVTNAEFEAFNPNHQRSLYGPDDDHPVTAVTYYEALRYCQEHGYRLPTRQEWLAAAIGNTAWTLPNSEGMDATQINRFDPESGEPGANFEGEYPPNPLGLHDMSGNVAEFNSPVLERTIGEIPMKLVLVSGGSWGGCKDAAVPYAYAVQDPFIRNDRVGFRVAKDAE